MDIISESDRTHGIAPTRLERILPILVCPECKGHLASAPQGLTCKSCKITYEIRNDKVYFIESMKSTDALDRIKELIKRRTGNLLYRFFIPLVAPTYPFNYRACILGYGDPRSKLIVDIGCGNHRLDRSIVALDGIDYPAVDIVADITKLPFKTGSVDIVASRSLLEHIHPIEAAIAEIRRSTAGGGINVHLIPFLFPFHSSVGDYQRFTHSGAAALFEGWKIVEQRHVTGPATLFLVCFIEFLSITLSMGNSRIKALIYLGASAILFPIKFLDFPFLYFKGYRTLAPSILTIAQKPVE